MSIPKARPSAGSGDSIAFCARSSLRLVEAMNLVRNSRLLFGGIDFVISNTKQMSCTIWLSAISGGRQQMNAMRREQDGQAKPTSRHRGLEAVGFVKTARVRSVNFVTVAILDSGTKLTPLRA
jgi:hypothetical protein